MNPILAEILSGAWLISNERSAAYASVLLSLIKGESIFEGDSSLARERNRPYILAGSGGENQRLGFSDTEIPEGSVAVIPIRSEILKYDQPCGPRGTQSILNDVKAADQNPNIKSIVLAIDSPGGQVAGTDLLAEAIKIQLPRSLHISTDWLPAPPTGSYPGHQRSSQAPILTGSVPLAP